MTPAVTPERPAEEPWAYLLTVACYGTRLHGDPRGSVDRERNLPGSRFLPEDSRRTWIERSIMREPAAELGRAERQVVLVEIRRTCDFRRWDLHAAHVRSTHFHVVATAPVTPEKVAGELKAYTSRALNDGFCRKEKRWVRHGSMIALWNKERFRNAIDYVVRGQGEPMAVWVDPKHGYT